jgi:excisionase family DNA binding protein
MREAHRRHHACTLEPEEAVRQVPAERIPELIALLNIRLAAEWAPRPSGRPDRDDGNLSVKEAAKRLGVSRDWLYRNSKDLPFTVRIGRRILFSASGLERWNSQRQGR